MRCVGRKLEVRCGSVVGATIIANNIIQPVFWGSCCGTSCHIITVCRPQLFSLEKSPSPPCLFGPRIRRNRTAVPRHVLENFIATL